MPILWLVGAGAACEPAPARANIARLLRLPCKEPGSDPAAPTERLQRLAPLFQPVRHVHGAPLPGG